MLERKFTNINIYYLLTLKRSISFVFVVFRHLFSISILFFSSFFNLKISLRCRRFPWARVVFIVRDRVDARDTFFLSPSLSRVRIQDGARSKCIRMAPDQNAFECAHEIRLHCRVPQNLFIQLTSYPLFNFSIYILFISLLLLLFHLSFLSIQDATENHIS